MNTEELIPTIETFTTLEEAQFDAGWCEGFGILGGITIDETPSIKECARIYSLTAEPAAPSSL